jgi:hypothetical protein
VQQHDGHGVRSARALVNEVDVEALDLGEEMVEPVEIRLGGIPVKTGAPVLRELLQIGEFDAAKPPSWRDFVGPARSVEPIVEVVELVLRQLNREWSDVHRFSFLVRLVRR